MAVLGLRFCVRAFSSCGKRGPLFIAVRGPLTIVASLVVEHRLQTHRLSSCGSQAQLLRGMWDLPRAGLEPVSPASAGGFSTTAPPGKPDSIFFKLTSTRTPPLLCIQFQVWFMTVTSVSGVTVDALQLLSAFILISCVYSSREIPILNKYTFK